MKKIPVVLLMAGLASFVVGCSHNKQKIVFVTEFLKCEKLLSQDMGGCNGETSKYFMYYGFDGEKVPDEAQAAWSVCAENSMSKEEFTATVNTDKFRVVSTTDWEDIFGSYQVGTDLFGMRPWRNNTLRVHCIGKEYVVTY